MRAFLVASNACFTSIIKKNLLATFGWLNPLQATSFIVRLSYLSSREREYSVESRGSPPGSRGFPPTEKVDRVGVGNFPEVIDVSCWSVPCEAK